MEALGTRLRRKLSKIRHRLMTLRGLRSSPVRGRHASQHPWRDLPVAAYPAMLPLAIGRIVVRHVFEQLDIAGEAHTGVRAFNQVVTQQGFGREAVADSLAERSQVINGLAVEDGFSKQVLLARLRRFGK